MFFICLLNEAREKNGYGNFVSVIFGYIRNILFESFAHFLTIWKSALNFFFCENFNTFV